MEAFVNTEIGRNVLSPDIFIHDYNTYFKSNVDVKELEMTDDFKKNVLKVGYMIDSHNKSGKTMYLVKNYKKYPIDGFVYISKFNISLCFLDELLSLSEYKFFFNKLRHSKSFK